MATGIIAIIILIGALATLASMASRTQARIDLARVGDFDGKTERDFEVALRRNPTSISAMPGGRLLQWQASGQHLAVMFDNEHRFVAVTHRHKV